jgi:HPt (histidine-containing phosphotransfer) domain-containing protein
MSLRENGEHRMKFEDPQPALELSDDMLMLRREAPEILPKLAALMFTNGPAQFNEAMTALRAGDAPEALARLHSLKSSIGSFGRSRAFAHIKSFETSLREKGAQWGHEHIGSLHADFDQFLEALRLILAK